ncbi:MAG: glutamate 5-kinase [Clostridia bacterium]|nr:glutamate 5-kinase [Clostridia bacterium]
MRIVVKVGTSTLAYASGRLNIRHMEEFCKVLSDLKNEGHEIIVVSSGAIGMGMGKLSLKKRPEDIPTRQAAAAVGQCELMYTYDKLFSEYNHIVAQLLITNHVVHNEQMHINFKNTINRLLEMDVIPIINENDTVATEEIGIGDNDTLAAIVTAYADADLLVLLSDIDGLYTADPHKVKDAKLIEEIKELTDEITALAGGKGSENGTGGMVTKLQAAKICMDSGCDMIITNGANPYVLYDITEGKNVGSRFIGKR